MSILVKLPPEPHIVEWTVEEDIQRADIVAAAAESLATLTTEAEPRVWVWRFSVAATPYLTANNVLNIQLELNDVMRHCRAVLIIGLPLPSCAPLETALQSLARGSGLALVSARSPEAGARYLDGLLTQTVNPAVLPFKSSPLWHESLVFGLTATLSSLISMILIDSARLGSLSISFLNTADLVFSAVVLAMIWLLLSWVIHRAGRIAAGWRGAVAWASFGITFVTFNVGLMGLLDWLVPGLGSTVGELLDVGVAACAFFNAYVMVFLLVAVLDWEPD